MTSLGPPPPVLTSLEGEILSVDEASARVEIRYPVLPKFMNPNGVLQGGIAVAMNDSAVGLCALLADPTRRSTTVELSSRFLRPLVKGHAVARGAVLKRGRTAVVVEVDLVNDAGELCVKTTATNVYLENE